MPELLDASADDFEVKVFAPRGLLVVVDFRAPGCPNCALFAADAPALLASLPEAGVRLVRVDVSASPELAARFGLIGVPAFVLVRDGRVLGRMSRYDGREHWLEVVRSRLALDRAE